MNIELCSCYVHAIMLCSTEAKKNQRKLQQNFYIANDHIPVIAVLSFSEIFFLCLVIYLHLFPSWSFSSFSFSSLLRHSCGWTLWILKLLQSHKIFDSHRHQEVHSEHGGEVRGLQIPFHHPQLCQAHQRADIQLGHPHPISLLVTVTQSKNLNFVTLYW